jgi:hypothetical protein
MKSFKIILSTCIIVVIAFTLSTTVSCKKGDVVYNDTTLLHPCDNVTCLNGGTCRDGNCKCPQGYEGENCATKWSDKFVGSFNASDACSADSAGFYSVNITANPDFAYKINLINLGTFCANTKVSANISIEKTAISIPFQQICGSTYCSGTGTMNGKYLNVFLTSRDSVSHTSTSCSILLSKK